MASASEFDRLRDFDSGGSSFRLPSRTFLRDEYRRHESDRHERLPYIVLKDPSGRKLDTYTHLQEATYRARQNIKQTREALYADEWRLPHAPPPARPDFSRAAPPIARTRERLKGDINHLSKSTRTSVTRIVEVDVDDVAFVAQSLHHLPKMPSLSFLRQEILSGPKDYFQIVQTMLLHKRFMKQTDKRDAIYNFPGFCSGCRRAGLCYGCEQSMIPHYHHGRLMKTGGGFTYYKKDQPEHQIPGRNPLNWKIQFPELALRSVMEAHENGVLGTLSEDAENIEHDEHCLIKTLMEEKVGLPDINVSKSGMVKTDLLGSRESDEKYDDEGIVADGKSLDDKHSRINHRSAKMSGTSGQGSDQSGDGYHADMYQDYEHDQYQNGGSRISHTLDLRPEENDEDQLSYDESEMAERMGRTSAGYIDNAEQDEDQDTEAGEGMDTDAGEGHEHEQYFTSGEENHDGQSSHLSRSRKRSSSSESKHGQGRQLQTGDGNRNGSVTTKSSSPYSRKYDRLYQGKAYSSESPSGSPSSSKRRLYKAPPAFKVKKSNRKKIQASSPFSTKRDYNLDLNKKFELKKSERKATQFQEFQHKGGDWKPPPKFELKDTERKDVKFWKPPKKKEPDMSKKRRPRPHPASPDSGLDSEKLQAKKEESWMTNNSAVTPSSGYASVNRNSRPNTQDSGLGSRPMTRRFPMFTNKRSNMTRLDTEQNQETVVPHYSRVATPEHDPNHLSRELPVNQDNNVEPLADEKYSRGQGNDDAAQMMTHGGKKTKSPLEEPTRSGNSGTNLSQAQPANQWDELRQGEFAVPPNPWIESDPNKRIKHGGIGVREPRKNSDATTEVTMTTEHDGSLSQNATLISSQDSGNDGKDKVTEMEERVLTPASQRISTPPDSPQPAPTPIRLPTPEFTVGRASSFDPVRTPSPIVEKPKRVIQKKQFIKKEIERKPPTPIARSCTPQTPLPEEKEPETAIVTPEVEEDTTPIKLPELVRLDTPPLPDIVEQKKDSTKKGPVKTAILPVPKLQEVQKPPEKKKKRPTMPRSTHKRRSKQPAEAPVTKEEVREMRDPLDFLAKYCIVSKDRLPFYERIYSNIIEGQPMKYERQPMLSPRTGMPISKDDTSNHEVGWEAHQLNMFHDLVTITRGRDVGKPGMNAPEQYVEKLAYTLEILDKKQRQITDDLHVLQSKKLRHIAEMAKEMIPDITRVNYQPKVSKKGKKKKKKKKKGKASEDDDDEEEPPQVPLRPQDITDEVIAMRLDESTFKKICKKGEIPQIELEMQRCAEKLANIDDRLMELEGEKNLLGLYCMEVFFNEQNDNHQPIEFRRQQSALYRHLHPDPDIEMNIEELEGALQVVNHHLISESEFDYLYQILNLPGRRKINFQLFTIIAALSEKISQMDPVIKKLLIKDSVEETKKKRQSYDALDLKMETSKELFGLLADGDYETNNNGNAKASQLAVELAAGGLDPEHVGYVLSKFNRFGTGYIDFLDFVTYVPLFIEIHQKIVDNPFNVSLDV